MHLAAALPQFCRFCLCFAGMNKAEISIATIAWARTEEEEETLRRSLTALSALNLPVFLTDGGSSAAFLSYVKSLPHFHVFSASGLWAQVKKSVVAAIDSGAGSVLYTEPDKLQFFEKHLPAMLSESSWNSETGVLLAARSKAGFASFPRFQQLTENAINQCCEEVVGEDTDYCYGPFLFRAGLFSSLHFLPETCGWGWRPALFALAKKKGLKVESWTGDFFCPPDQQVADSSENIYRMRQLTQNIEGLVLAATVQP